MRIPYQPEVDGLRAVAILAVVLYHVGLPAVSGGFAGVDVFFVISGYLIFSLLYREQQAFGTIRWTAFYARRVTRLLPEACALIVAVMIAGYFILLPISLDHERALSQTSLAESGLAATGWVTNFYFSLVGMGYFQPSIGREPLIHLWSLGVEEQFYLVVPLMFLLAGVLGRLTRRASEDVSAKLLVLVFLTSLATAVWWSDAHPWSAYYMLPTRAYEFAIGAGVALWMSRSMSSPQPALGVAGLVAIVAACFGLDRNLAFPSAWALIPTVGTALVLVAIARRPPAIVSVVLGNGPATYLGKISYGWYLWHWPMIVLWKEYWLYDVSPASVGAVAAAALVPAALGYHVVARLRRRVADEHASPRRVFAFGAAGVASALVACGGLTLAANIGVATPAGQLLNARLQDRWTAPPRCVEPLAGPLGALPECFFGDTRAKTTVVLWGDSHALHWLPALDPLLKDLRLRGLLRVYAGCPPGLSLAGGVTPHFRRCAEFNAAVLQDVVSRARETPTAVLLFSRWVIYTRGEPFSYIDREMSARDSTPPSAAVERSFDDLAGRLAQAGIPVGIGRPVPEQRYEIPGCLYRMTVARCSVAVDSLNRYLAPAREMVDRIATRTGAAVFDPTSELCPGDVCPAQLDDKVLYVDDDHLSGEGARSASAGLRILLESLTAPQHPGPLASDQARSSVQRVH